MAMHKSFEHQLSLPLIVKTTWILEMICGASNRSPVWIIKVPRHHVMQRHLQNQAQLLIQELVSFSQVRCGRSIYCRLYHWHSTWIFVTNLMSRICLKTSFLNSEALGYLIFLAESTKYSLSHCKNACRGRFRYFESCRAEIKCWEHFLIVMCHNVSS